MIETASGDLFASDVEALVNPVNCVGVMGRGLALQFKRAFPTNFALYIEACRAKALVPGTILTTRSSPEGPVIFNFPTKRHWRSHSRLEDIDTGLSALVVEVRRLAIRSLAIPALGCGLGELAWSDVLPRIRASFNPLQSTRVLVFAPR